MAITRTGLEENQVAIYFAAVVAGAIAAVAAPGAAWGAVINPALAALLYVTFLQVPLADLRRSLANGRFLLTLLAVNFVAAPLVAFALASMLPGEQWVLRLGVLMVLLAPCIDYVVVFTHLGRGDARLILAATPVLLVAQMLLLPVYLGLFIGERAMAMMQPGPFIEAFVWLIAVPLALAAATQAWAARFGAGKAVADAMGWLPVPLMAVVLLVVIAAVAPNVAAQAGSVAMLVPVYVALAALMPVVGSVISRYAGMEAGAARAVTFSGGTRNSLVVLPLAFAIPEAGALLPAAVVTQTLVELVAMLVYIRWVPRLVPANPGLAAE
ncbi:arsenic resistance protein [Roseomonas mucosa]|uniref:Arsenical-resistance protein n=1 Tax=Roseomonas mucosa TaxID=207340 RepID=A0A379N4Y2_9PROT|nr:arsenic resistance protein [Roseomonas mucosa]QDE00220.1 Arsenical-resistance protein ACR3 [Roseomonas mucosa]SUE41440.1 arsenical-resistance protein [Roseomonas mucosa]